MDKYCSHFTDYVIPFERNGCWKSLKYVDLSTIVDKVQELAFYSRCEQPWGRYVQRQGKEAHGMQSGVPLTVFDKVYLRFADAWFFREFPEGYLFFLPDLFDMKDYFNIHCITSQIVSAQDDQTMRNLCSV